MLGRTIKIIIIRKLNLVYKSLNCVHALEHSLERHEEAQGYI